MTTTITPVRKSVTVPAPPEAAFRRFTEELGSWWPLVTHSVTQSDESTAHVECREGGRIYERAPDGTEHEWGRITTWSPPDRVVFTWHPGRGPSTAQEVEVVFRGVADSTRVELEHRGWERFGDGAAEMREDYDRGWDPVLARYVASLTG